MSDTSKSLVSNVVRWILTALIALIVIWWLFIVRGYVGTAATKDSTSGLTLDAYGRAKETLAVVVPFLTLVLGYWFGAKGTDEAKADAEKANLRTTAITAEAPSSAVDEARKKYPKIFGS